MTLASAAVIDPAALLDRFRRIRARTRMMFDLLAESVYYTRPIALRNPIVFYEGHLPAFAVNTLVKKALGRPGIDPHLEDIFARGIDPETEANALARGNPAWPSRAVVQDYAAAADRALEEAIAVAASRAGDDAAAGHAIPLQQALWTILEHEEMHHETLAYMWHEIPYDKKRRPQGYATLGHANNSGRPAPDLQQGPAGHVTIPAGTATLGTRSGDGPFAWDNELEAHDVGVDAFTLDTLNVTNEEFLAFVDAGGYRDARWWRAEDWAWVQGEAIAHPRFWEREGGRWHWRAMFERVPLPSSWPVYVTWAEAAAYASWRGMRLMTEAEYHRAAAGSVPVNIDFTRWDPVPVGSAPAAASAFGVHDLVGNGWEWTATLFGPFRGFVPMASYPEYSADFFDDEHFVMKGASPVTAAGLVRPGFRNWFRPRYPFVYATFRCARTP
jgi:gamma-glutamyl hercynylcysteine S-oxide synthase